jgi:hypothetical protein
LIVASVLFFAVATMTPGARRCVTPRVWFPARKCALYAALKRLLARRKSNSLRYAGAPFGNRGQDDARWLQWSSLRNRRSGGGTSFASATPDCLKTTLG